MTTESLPHWDLSNVFPGLESGAFREAVQQVRADLDALDGYLATHSIERGGLVPQGGAAPLAAIIGGYLERTNAVRRLYETLYEYTYAFFSTDSYDATARRLMSELEALAVRLECQEVLFTAWLGTVAEEPLRFRAALAVDGPVKDHAFTLQEAADRSRYLMSASEEALAAELSLSGSRAWERLQGVVCSQIVMPLEQAGQVEDLPITVIQNLRSDPDAAVRRRAYEAELVAWERVREPLAACMNGIKGTVNTLNRRRGRPDCLHRPLEQARIDRETLDAMLGVMRDSSPGFRRYFRRKAQRLGREALPWWDLFAPVGKPGRTYSFAEARAFLLEEFGRFSPRLQAMTRRAFDRRWIDAEPRDGKQGGAFCTELLSVDEPRVLCNYDGSFEAVATLAHELGHAYHVECQAGLTPLQRRTPMTLAETASTMLEMLITDAVLERSQDPAEELAILEHFLTDAAQTVVDIYSRYLFEKEVFERRIEAELSADEFCELMLQAQRETYGDGLDPDYLNPYMWAWKPHYYSAGLSFYNFPYTFGMLFSLGLYAIYQQRGPAFLPEYDELLRSTGAGTSADLAARFGIDIRGRAFWQQSMGVIEARIERYLAL